MKTVAIIALLVGCAEERERSTWPVEGVHPSGWLDAHGKDLEQRGWDFALCQSCHGSDFAGTSSAPSCLMCHTKGPTACDTCHGTPPATGAHTAHVAQGLACSECHQVPETWDSPGHILDENRQPIPPPARVTFGAFANLDVTPSRRTAPASWDHDSGTCASVYCHGGIFGDSTASHSTPAWTGGSAQVACGGCHGTPPSDHAQNECATCHSNARHLDGVVDVGNTCTSCHGDSTSPAPPRGLHGETETTSLAVGAHRTHLVAGRWRGPIACDECHQVPAAVGAAGHIDTALPAELAFGTLARSDGAQPAWDRSTATCSNVYCHGGGTHLAGELANPLWTSTNTPYCGGCHGLPPSDSFHAPSLTLFDCATCHAGTVGPFGNVLVANGKHINGVFDVE